MMTIKNYVRAESLQEAYDLNQSRRNRIIGGMLWLKLSNAAVNTAIDISGLGLDTIEEDDQQFSIGAMVSLRQLEEHVGLNAYSQGAVANAVKDIVGVQFRNMATVGGSIYGRFGFSDVLTIFMAMDAQVELFRGGIVSLEAYAKMKKDRDILVRLIVKKQPAAFSYQAVRNARTDFPVLACAVSCLNGEYRICAGARPGRTVLLRDETGILSAGITQQSADCFAEYAAERIPTGSNIRGSAAYRSRLIRVLTARALMKMGGDNHGN